MKEELVSAWKDYELIDSGDGLRLERFGTHTLVRPDTNVIWKPSNPGHPAWKKADLIYSGKSHQGRWEGDLDLLAGWRISYGAMEITIQPTGYGHVGVFPEQAGHWKWLEETIKKHSKSKGQVKVLNLFAYTGGASIVAALAGASVCHVDASKASIYKAKENAQASGLPTDAIRWIVDDVMKFLQREERRGNAYDIIIMDPPVFGRGPKGEIWRLEDELSELAQLTAGVLSKNAIGLLVNMYATSLYPQSMARVFEQANPSLDVELGVLSIEESYSKKSLPTGYFLRTK